MNKLRKPIIRKLEAIEQCIEAVQSDLSDVLVEVRDLLAPPEDRRRRRKGVGHGKP